MPDDFYLVYVRDFAGRPRPQRWSQRSFAMDRKAEDERIAGRFRIEHRHVGLPFADLVLLYPLRAACLHRDRRAAGPPLRTRRPFRPEPSLKNRLSDLNNHLFAQLERLADEELTPELLDKEAKRGEAMVAVADQIIRNAALQIRAAELVSEYGSDPTPYLPVPSPKNEAPAIEAKNVGKAK